MMDLRVQGFDSIVIYWLTFPNKLQLHTHTPHTHMCRYILTHTHTILPEDKLIKIQYLTVKHVFYNYTNSDARNE